MKRMTGGALVLALLVPAAALAQRPDASPRNRRAMELPNVARALVSQRAELGLDDSQVARLEELARESETRRAELRSLREQFAGATELSDEDRGRLRDAMRSAMQAGRETREGIRSVLTVEQSERAARIGDALRSLSHDREGMRAGPAPRRDRLRSDRRPGAGGRRGMRPGRRPGDRLRR